MTRQSRLKDYKAMRGPKGESTSANINYWSERASENSKLAPRAKRNMKLPSTGEMQLGETDRKPEPHTRDKAMDDLNFEGDSAFMKSVRRGA